MDATGAHLLGWQRVLKKKESVGFQGLSKLDSHRRRQTLVGIVAELHCITEHLAAKHTS